MKPLLIGQAPSRVMRPGDVPFKGTQALVRLAKYCGANEPDILYELFDFMNLSDEYPGPVEEGSKWDAKPVLTNDRINELQKAIMSHEQVVLLGAVARDTFMSKKAQMFVWRNASSTPTVLWTWSAHPGGTSFFWNDVDNRAKGRKFWSELYQHAAQSARVTEWGMSRAEEA